MNPVEVAQVLAENLHALLNIEKYLAKAANFNFGSLIIL